jgi:hypothetical protein
MVGFDNGQDRERILDGKPVADINSNLTATADTTVAQRLPENGEISFYSDVKSGRFDLPWEEALRLLASPNPHGRPNSDVLRSAGGGCPPRPARRD